MLSSWVFFRIDLFIFFYNITIQLIKVFCYVLIIPAFGIVSHIVSTFSGKPIFGQIGMVLIINIAELFLLCF
jgi:hypothetical protein